MNLMNLELIYFYNRKLKPCRDTFVYMDCGLWLGPLHELLPSRFGLG
jgi:hypothetical protein